MNKSGRLANIELLRALAMLLIVIYHFSSHGLVLQDYDFEDSNRFANWLLRGVGYIGVNVYILISSFFLCEGKFKTKKLFQLLLEVWFYSVFIYVICVRVGWVNFSLKSLFTSFFPTLCGEYWFITSYVVLYLLSPFLNKGIHALVPQEGVLQEHFRIIDIPLVRLSILLFLFFSVVPNFVFFSPWLHFGGTCGIVWMIVVYIWGATLRQVVRLDKLKTKKKIIWSLAILFWILPLITKVIIANISVMITGQVIGSSIFYMNNSIIVVASSVFTFLAFLTIDIKSGIVSSAINKFAPSTLAIYLIHDNNYIRPNLWTTINEVLDNRIIIFQTIFFSLLIFLICGGGCPRTLT